MFAIVKYTDNTMENFEIIEMNQDLSYLDKRSHDIRRIYYKSIIKPLFRIIEIDWTFRRKSAFYHFIRVKCRVLGLKLV